MTVASAVSRVSYNGNGSTQNFAVPFYFLANSHLRVVLRSSTGVETLQVLTTNYTVSGAGNPAGGQVSMVIAPPSGSVLVINRNVPITQETDYQANDPFPAESHERALDKLTMIAQQAITSDSLAIKIPETETNTTQLPVAATRANKMVAFDNGGNVTVTGFTVTQVQAAINSTGSGSGTTNASTIIYDPAVGSSQILQDRIRQLDDGGVIA